MDRVPVKNGRSCVFRVVRVSGTMRKVEEEAIRQARLLMLAAKATGSQAPAGGTKLDALSSMFGTTTAKPPQDVPMVDVVDDSSDDEESQDHDDYDDGDEQDDTG